MFSIRVPLHLRIKWDSEYFWYPAPNSQINPILIWTLSRGRSRNFGWVDVHLVSPRVRESKTFLDSGFHAIDSKNQVQDSGFQSLEGFRIPWAVWRGEVCRHITMVALFLDNNKTNGDGKEIGKKWYVKFILTNNNFARASRYFVHFFAVIAPLGHETS